MQQLPRALSTRRYRTKAGSLTLLIAVLFASACGASAGIEVTEVADTASQTSTAPATESSEPEPDAAVEDESREPAESSDEPAPVETAVEEDEAASEPSSSPQIGQGIFELVLESGESFSAPVSCVLQPQIAAGSEILFTASGQQDGHFYDVTQWGETVFGGTQDVEVVDSTTFDSLWRATGSTGLELELNGNVISGSGGFYPGEEFGGPYTQGQLTVTC